MIVAALVLTVSTALFFFYLQATCQKILRRQFGRDYFQPIANANQLEFPSLRKSLEEFGLPVDYPRTRMMLKCDFLALTYLLKNAANVSLRYSYDEHLLVLYFRWQLVSLAMRRLLKVSENKAILRLLSVLQYFANVVGQRLDTVRFGSLTATDYFLNLESGPPRGAPKSS